MTLDTVYIGTAGIETVRWTLGYQRRRQDAELRTTQTKKNIRGPHIFGYLDDNILHSTIGMYVTAFSIIACRGGVSDLKTEKALSGEISG